MNPRIRILRAVEAVVAERWEVAVDLVYGYRLWRNQPGNEEPHFVLYDLTRRGCDSLASELERILARRLSGPSRR